MSELTALLRNVRSSSVKIETSQQEQREIQKGCAGEGEDQEEVEKDEEDVHENKDDGNVEE